MQNRQQGLLPLLLISLQLAACGSSSKQSESDESWLLREDLVEFDERVTIEDRTLSVDATTTELAQVPVDFQLKLNAELLPPTLQGTLLQATAVAVGKKYAYVSYAVAGDTQRGAIVCLDITDPLTPRMVSELLFLDRDINALTLDGEVLYAVGASSSQAGTPAFLRRIELNSGKLTSSMLDADLPSYAGTGVTVTDSAVYTSSGDQGGLSVFAKESLQPLQSSSIYDARSVQFHPKSSEVVVLSGRPGTLHVFSKDGLLVRKSTVGGATIASSKSTIVAGQTLSLAALSDGGVSLICQADGQVVAHASIPQVTGISASASTTNAAASAKSLLYTANGEAGLFVYAMKHSLSSSAGHCDEALLPQIGSINFGSAVSVNHVEVKNDLLFVATGLGGLKIVSVERSKQSDDVDDFDE